MIVAGSVACTIVWLTSADLHIKLLAALVALALGLATLMLITCCVACGKSRRWRRIFFKAMFVAPVVALALDLGLALKDWKEGWRPAPARSCQMFIPSDVCNYRLKPSRRYERWGATVAIDRNGFRSPYDVALSKNDDRVRIFLTGGSAAFGWGVPDGSDIASHMRTLLGAEGVSDRYEVVNASVPYYASFQQANWYIHVLSDFQPDVLIVLHGYNDLSYAIDAGRDWRPAREESIGPKPVCAPEWLPPLLMRSALYRRLYWRANRFLRSTEQAADETEQAKYVDAGFIDQFVKHRGLVAAYARQNGTLCILALQPMIYQGKALTEKERQLARMWGDQRDATRNVLPALREASAEMRVEGMIAVDLIEVFEDFREDAYYDKCHYTSEGNRIVAAKLADIVRQHFP